MEYCRPDSKLTFKDLSSQGSIGLLVSLHTYDVVYMVPVLLYEMNAFAEDLKNSLVARRFQNCFPKTGGGEDIDFLIQHMHGTPLVSVPSAIAVHPWWAGGRISGYRYVGLWVFVVYALRWLLGFTYHG